MRSAPSVNAPVGRSCLGVLLAGAAWLAAAAELAAWAWATPPGGRHGLVASVLLACAVAAWEDRSRSRAGRLEWDGALWWWHEGAKKWGVEPEVCVDLQSLMLVRLAPLAGARGPARWHWLRERDDTSAWPYLRCALHAWPTRARASPVPDSPT